MVLFGSQDRNDADIPPLPCTMVLIQNFLKVHTFHFQVQMNGKSRDAIGYRTEGLSRNTPGQQEIVLIVLKEIAKRTKHFVFNDPLRLFKQIYHMQTPVRHGDTTKFGARSLFDAAAILYVQMPRGIGFFEDCLSMILLADPHELAMLSMMGHMRLLAYLGHQHSFYPYPYWSDIQRRPWKLRPIMGSLDSFDGRCFLPSTSTLTHYPSHNKVILRMQMKGTIPIQEAPRMDKSIVLFPGKADESAYGCYVYVPNQRNLVTAIIPSINAATGNYHNNNNDSMACCFVSITGGRMRNAIRRLEDGISLFFTEDTWSIFWHYLRYQKNFSFFEEGTTFLLQWV
mmetsp:Transcript_28324/g.42835  ORF Transcript_28324/g.42835 Transcript_28324/m.42835 type:complete len:341 (-) Transcript_28324:4128-5150(-)